MSRRLLAGTLVLGGVILAVVFGLDGPRPVYAYDLGDFLARPIRDKTVRLQGRLVHGSLCRTESPCEFAFRMMDPHVGADALAPAERELAVHYPSCVVPDTFGDVPGWDISLSVEGTLCTGCHVFEASQVIAKCPAKYQMRGHGGTSLEGPRPIRRCAVGAK